MPGVLGGGGVLVLTQEDSRMPEEAPEGRHGDPWSAILKKLWIIFLSCWGSNLEACTVRQALCD